MRVLACVAALIALATTTPASALDMSCLHVWSANTQSADLSKWFPSGRRPILGTSCYTAHLKGKIVVGDADEFARLLREHHPFLTAVGLTSPGGDVAEAMKVGRMIRRYLLYTGVTKMPFDPDAYLAQTAPRSPATGFRSRCISSGYSASGAGGRELLRERLLPDLGGRSGSRRGENRASPTHTDRPRQHGSQPSVGRVSSSHNRDRGVPARDGGTAAILPDHGEHGVVRRGVAVRKGDRRSVRRSVDYGMDRRRMREEAQLLLARQVLRVHEGKALASSRRSSLGGEMELRELRVRTEEGRSEWSPASIGRPVFTRLASPLNPASADA